jgi:protein transport protein SEC13
VAATSSLIKKSKNQNHLPKAKGERSRERMATVGTVRAPVHHDDLIHDAQLDYYGLRLATCSSDRLVKIFDVISQNGSQPKVEFSCDLLGHTGPVWEVAWAHPRWGTLLASCSYDASVIIHRQNENGTWEEAFKFQAKGSVNSIEWCPFEYGVALACASSDGNVYVLRCDTTTWEWSREVEIHADKVGCNSVTWAPYGALGSLTPDGRWVMKLACGGADQTVKIYRCEMDQQNGAIWHVDQPEILEHHKDWVRDVAWAPSVGLPYNLLASCSEDGSVCIWSQEAENEKWKKEELPNFKAPVWRVAWSVTGSLLAVSAGDSDVTLWKESLDEKKWVKISEVKDKSAPSSSQIPAAPVDERPPVSAAPQQAQTQYQARKDSSERVPLSQQPSPRSVGKVVEEPVSNPQREPEEEPTVTLTPTPQEPQPQTTWEGAGTANIPEEQVRAADVDAANWQGEQQGNWGGDINAAQADQGGNTGAPGEYAPDQYQYDSSQQQQWSEDPNAGYYDQSVQPGYEAGYDAQQYDANYYQQQQGWDPNQQQQWADSSQQQWGADGSYQQTQQQWGDYSQQQPAAADWSQQQTAWDPNQQQQPAGLAAPPVHAGQTYQPPAGGQPQYGYGGQQ